MTAAAEIAAALGEAPHLGVVDVACPICGPDRRSPVNRVRRVLRVWRVEPGFSTFCCARCGWSGYERDAGAPARVTDAALAGAGVSSPASVRTGEQRIGRALELWREARPIAGSVAERYLAGRAIILTDDVLAADALRFHRRCPFGPHRYPAMLALMRDLHTDRPVAVHRTAILPDGNGKATPADGGNAKRMLGPVKGAVVKLIADDAVTLGLGIAEGIETALTMMAAGWAPVWAAGSTGAIRRFPVLAGIECLTIFADADDGGTGLADARHCAERWRAAGAEATVVAPPSGDWNDVVGGAA